MSFYSSVTNYSFLPIPLFILMGNIVFTSGTGTRLIDGVDQIMGKLPGRLSLLAIGSGVLLGTMIGISGGSIGILGKVLVPEFSSMVIYALMALVLLWRPQGLFGRPT